MNILSNTSNFNSSSKFFIALITFVMYGCFPTQNINPVEQRNQEREKVIERYILGKTSSSEKYESLGFGPVKLYKPDAFFRLDSLYAIKFKYEERGQLHQFERLGLNDEIEAAKQEAREQKDEVTFEIEHIYSKRKGTVLTIYHDYFVLTQNDSVKIHTPFYHYELPLSYQNMHINYLFELHFLTDFDNIITDRELSFIKYFKEREQELIGQQDKLNDFMVHTLSLMLIAKGARSVDFVELAKSIANSYLARAYKDVVVTNYGSLIAEEDENGRVKEYKFSLQWRGIVNGEIQKMETEITFSPYLEPKEVEDIKIED